MFKASDSGAATETTVSDNKARYKPALQLGEDTFVFRAAPPRKLGKKYALDAEGPDPQEGAWIAEEAKVRGGKRAWRWKPKGEAATEERDGWIHEGDEPVFDPLARKWQLRSEKPSLFFRRKGKAEATKVETGEDGVVTIAEDSEMALRKMKEREEKHQKSLALKRPAVAAIEALASTKKEAAAAAAETAPECQVKLEPGGAIPAAVPSERPALEPETPRGRSSPKKAPGQSGPLQGPFRSRRTRGICRSG